jgi:predicted Zn finger-like uncharacterized protein
MEVRCERCRAQYSVDDGLVDDAGLAVRCSKCGHLFRVMRPGRGWRVRGASSGEIQTLPDLATLQTWVVEGRVARQDELSRDGAPWVRAAEVRELEPFFAVVARAAPSGTVARGAGEAALVRPPLPKQAEPTRRVQGEPSVTGSFEPVSEANSDSWEVKVDAAAVADEPAWAAPPAAGATRKPQPPPRPGVAGPGPVERGGPTHRGGPIERRGSERPERMPERRRAVLPWVLVVLALLVGAGAIVFFEFPGLLGLDAPAATSSPPASAAPGSSVAEAPKAPEPAKAAPKPVEPTSPSGERVEPPKPSVEPARPPESAGSAQPTAAAAPSTPAPSAGAARAPESPVPTHVPPTTTDPLRPAPEPARPEEAAGAVAAAPRPAESSATSAEPGGTARTIPEGSSTAAAEPAPPAGNVGGVPPGTAATIPVPSSPSTPGTPSSEGTRRRAAAPASGAVPGAPSTTTPTAPTTPGAKVATRGSEASQKRSVKALLGEARRLRDQGKSEAALDVYGRALQADPENGDALAGRGLCYLDLSRYVPAEESFKAALAANDSHPAALMGLAETYRYEGRRADAVTYYRRYLAAHPRGEDATAARNAIQSLEERP